MLKSSDNFLNKLTKLTTVGVVVALGSIGFNAAYADNNAPGCNDPAYQTGFYLQGLVGVNQAQNQISDTLEYKLGYNGGVELGYQWQNWAVGLASDYFYNKMDKYDYYSPYYGSGADATLTGSSTKITDIMLNGYYYIPLGMQVVPFVGAGIGWAHAKTTLGTVTYLGEDVVYNTSQTTNTFAYQPIVGLKYQVTPNLDVRGEYRYFSTYPIKFNYGDGYYVKDHFHAGVVDLGLRYIFAQS